MDEALIQLMMVLLGQTVKNRQKKAKLKKALLGVRDAINALYGEER